tara:strand:- start:464 stop:1126 length:663 start_codon:yes stop_codon:yes gene_type:complete
MSLTTYITERKQSAARTAVNGIEFIILDKGKFDTADIQYLLNQIEEKTSPESCQHIHQIKLGSFPKLEKENYKSYYKDGVMYLSNKENFVEELLMNFFHELAHSFEKPYFDQIYGDRFLEKEFLNKRNRLKSVITMYEGGRPPPFDFNKINYSKELDDYLANTIGYEKLWKYSAGIFTNPYAATSLREYFAAGFESWLKGDQNLLYRISPVLYNKLKQFF